MNAERARRDVELDAALVEGARQGDEAKFRQLYHRHVDGLFALLTRLVGPVPERDDMVQQIFLDVHRALAAFRGDAAFSTFLYRVAVNVAYEHLGRLRRRRIAPLDEAHLDEIVAPGGSPEARAQKRQELARLFALLERVAPKKRIAFVLVAVEGMDYAETAALVGASPDAVKQRVLAARRELAGMIARREGSP